VVPRLVTLVEEDFALNAVVKSGVFQSVCFDKEKRCVQKDMIDNFRRRHFLLNWAVHLD